MYKRFIPIQAGFDKDTGLFVKIVELINPDSTNNVKHPGSQQK